jgi:hypothetical protein
MATCTVHPPAATRLVIAGLDPAIHRAAATMDARIKSGHDKRAGVFAGLDS